MDVGHNLSKPLSFIVVKHFNFFHMIKNVNHEIFCISLIMLLFFDFIISPMKSFLYLGPFVVILGTRQHGKSWVSGGGVWPKRHLSPF